MKRITSILLGTVILYVGTVAQEWVNALDSILQELAQEGFYDGQVLLAEKGEVLFNQAYGHWNHREKTDKVTLQTPMVVYSVGKSFTALAVMQLKVRGLLDYDDEVMEYIEGFPYPGVTIRHLLTMTSGLPRFLETAIRYADTTKVISNKEIIDLVIRYQPKAGAYGVEFNYNNTNYLLLATIVEYVSGLPFAQYLQEYIFDPAEMKNSYETVPEIVDSLLGSSVDANNFYQPYGAGSVATTASDLFLFDQALYEGRFVDTMELINEAFACMELSDHSMSNYGFGWRIHNCDTLIEVYHVGDGTDMRASLQRFLKYKRTFIYLHASSNVYHKSVYQVIRNIWEGKTYELPEKRKRYNIDTLLYSKYVGGYSSSFGLLHISSDGQKLFLRPDPIPGREELVPSSDTTFYFADQNLEWEFFLNEDGEVVGFGIKGDRENMGLKQ